MKKYIFLIMLAVIAVFSISCAYAESDVVIVKKTAAEQKEVDVRKDMVPCTFHVDGTLVDLEAITFQTQNSDGTWQDMKEAGEVIAIDVTQSYISIYAPCKLRLDKDVTTNQVGVLWDK